MLWPGCGGSQLASPEADMIEINCYGGRIGDRMALALCSWRPVTCANPCTLCQAQSAAVAHEIARQLRKRHGGSSQVADWLDGVGCHSETVQTVQQP